MAERPDQLSWDPDQNTNPQNTNPSANPVLRGLAGEDDPAVIRARIERTRMNMSETVDEIQDRLAPERLRYEAQEAIRDATIGKVEEMADKVNRKARSWRAGIVDTIKDNPVPAALVGLGLGWLLMSGSDEPDYPQEEYQQRNYYERNPYQNRYQDPYAASRNSQYPYQPYRDPRDYRGYEPGGQGPVDQARDKAADAASMARAKVNEAGEVVQDKAQEVMGEVQHTAQEVADQVQHQAEQVGYQAQYQARRAQRGYERTMRENPLSLGAVALAVGAAVGLAIPHTRQEDAWLGETRDQLIHEAQNKAGEVVDKVQHVASEAQDAAKEAAKSEMKNGRTDGSSGATAYDAHQERFRNHYRTAYASGGKAYSHYEPAYRWGCDLAQDAQYRNRNWSEAEPQLRNRWGERNQGSWEDFKDAVQEGWDQVRAAV